MTGLHRIWRGSVKVHGSCNMNTSRVRNPVTGYAEAPCPARDLEE